mmetsp:Transcript_7774/g.15906  ORF Transcript_7774/g.15906 Transcript_7774/m.15906 type:complete len:589 (-) Transcript_7774:189-1955(-)
MKNLPAILAAFVTSCVPCGSEARPSLGWIRHSSSVAINHRKISHVGHDVNHNGILRSLHVIRGGGINTDFSDHYQDGDEDEDDDLGDLMYDLERNDESEEDEESHFEEMQESEDDEEAKEQSEREHDEAMSPASSSAASGPPVKVTVSTNLLPSSSSSGTSILDQKLEFTASRKRTVLGIKQAISKTMVGRPYLGCSAERSEGGLLGERLVLRYQGRVLDDDESIEDVVAGAGLDDEEEEEDEEDEGSDAQLDDDDDDVIKLKFTLDILPPIDAKFGIELMEKVKKLSTKDLMEAYCTNMAGMVYGQELIQKELNKLERLEKGLEDGGGVNVDEEDVADVKDDEHQNPNHSLNIRKAAALIKKQMLNSLSPEALRLMEEEHDRVQQFLSSDGGDSSMTGEQSAASVFGLIAKDSTERRHRSGLNGGLQGRSLKGGATMNIKRVLQRNMNVNWADTTRNSLLFLFFGYFGGRNSFSRTFLLLSSPLCFVLQTRPIKVALKQLFYTIGEPPGILLSLLPAPQQAIMSLDYGGVMRELYGEKVLEGEKWMEMEMRENTRGVAAGDENELDIDEDLEEFDEDSDYEFDEDED